jgi:hypothetical protein
MPHDANGQPLKVGDIVTMRFRVTFVGTSERECNVTMEALDFASKGQSYRPIVSCNSKLAQRLTERLAELLEGYE